MGKDQHAALALDGELLGHPDRQVGFGRRFESKSQATLRSIQRASFSPRTTWLAVWIGSTTSRYNPRPFLSSPSTVSTPSTNLRRTRSIRRSISANVACMARARVETSDVISLVSWPIVLTLGCSDCRSSLAMRTEDSTLDLTCWLSSSLRRVARASTLAMPTSATICATRATAITTMIVQRNAAIGQHDGIRSRKQAQEKDRSQPCS